MNRIAATLLLIPLAAACSSDGGEPPDDVDVTTDPANVDGFKFETPVFEVPEGEEIQDCYFMQMPDLNGDGTPVWFDKVRIGVNGGSHHTNIFRVRTIVNLGPGGENFVHNGECFKSANWADWPLVANNQLSGGGDYFTWELPTDVAFQIPVGE